MQNLTLHFPVKGITKQLQDIEKKYIFLYNSFSAALNSNKIFKVINSCVGISYIIGHRGFKMILIFRFFFTLIRYIYLHQNECR